MAADPYKQSARLDYFPSPNQGGYRSATDFIVLHSTEGSTPEGAAGWFKNPKSQVSAHIVVGDNVTYRCVPNDAVAWHAYSYANHHGLGIEHTGFAKYTWTDWVVKHRGTLKRSAYQAAKMAKSYNIPVVWLSPADLKAGKRGFTSHKNISTAFAGDHQDPGAGFPRWLYLRWVKGYLKGL